MRWFRCREADGVLDKGAGSLTNPYYYYYYFYYFYYYHHHHYYYYYYGLTYLLLHGLLSIVEALHQKLLYI